MHLAAIGFDTCAGCYFLDLQQAFCCRGLVLLVISASIYVWIFACCSGRAGALVRCGWFDWFDMVATLSFRMGPTCRGIVFPWDEVGRTDGSQKGEEAFLHRGLMTELEGTARGAF